MTDTAVIGYQTTEYDMVDETIAMWNETQIITFDIMCNANTIVGKRDGGTRRLADAMKREVDTIERYAAGGALWLAMLQHYPSDSELWRESLDPSFWMAVGAKFKRDVRHLLKELNLPDAEAYHKHPEKFAAIAKSASHWLNEAMENKWTVEKLRSMLPTVTVGESPFTRATKRIVGIIEKDILNAPALNSGMNDAERRVFIKVSSWLVNFLKGKGLA